MYCYLIIHDELDELLCPSCYKQMKERSVLLEKCWDKQCLENEYHVIVFTSC